MGMGARKRGSIYLKCIELVEFSLNLRQKRCTVPQACTWIDHDALLPRVLRRTLDRVPVVLGRARAAEPADVVCEERRTKVVRHVYPRTSKIPPQKTQKNAAQSTRYIRAFQHSAAYGSSWLPSSKRKDMELRA